MNGFLEAVDKALQDCDKPFQMRMFVRIDIWNQSRNDIYLTADYHGRVLCYC